MRTIKFRAWDLVLDEMVGWDRLIQNGAFMSILGDKNYNIMQYTGLKDKNGKEIYEGDIVDAHWFSFDGHEQDNREKCIVKYYEENSAFGLHPIKSEDLGYIEPLICSDGGIEVIGNIHEHKHLLNE